MTSAVIEILPGDWDQDSQFGDGWDEMGIDPARAWKGMLERWLDNNYPGCYVSGDEIRGPATYRFPDAFVQPDTPRANDLPTLPEEGLYEAFQALHRNDWAEAIIAYAKAEG